MKKFGKEKKLSSLGGPRCNGGLLVRCSAVQAGDKSRPAVGLSVATGGVAARAERIGAEAVVEQISLS